MNLFEWLFRTHGFVPHGRCGGWTTSLIDLHVLMNMAIAVAYFCISGLVLYLWAKRKSRQEAYVLPWFSAFILACGGTHFIGALVFRYPVYNLEAVWLGITAAVSVSTAVVLWPYIPMVLSLRTEDELMREVSLRREMEQKLRELGAEQELFRDLSEARSGMSQAYKVLDHSITSLLNRADSLDQGRRDQS